MDRNQHRDIQQRGDHCGCKRYGSQEGEDSCANSAHSPSVALEEPEYAKTGHEHQKEEAKGRDTDSHRKNLVEWGVAEASKDR